MNTRSIIILKFLVRKYIQCGNRCCKSKRKRSRKSRRVVTQFTNISGFSVVDIYFQYIGNNSLVAPKDIRQNLLSNRGILNKMIK